MPPETVPMPRGMRADFAASWPVAAAFLAIGIYWGSFAALVPVLKARVGASDAEFGVAMLVAAVGALMAMWVAARIDAALGRRALPAMTAVLALAFLLPGLATTVWAFALAMLCASCASGALDVLMNARLSEVERRTGRSLMSLNHGLFSVTYAASALYCGVARDLGFGPVVILAALGLVSLMLIRAQTRLTVERPPAGADEAGRRGLALLPTVLLGFIILLAYLAEQGTEGWSALYLERGLGARASGGALGPALLGLTMGFGRIFGQTLVARIGEVGLMRGGALLAACGGLLAALAPTIWIAYLGFALLGLGISVIGPMAYALAGRDCTDAGRARTIAEISVIGYFGFFIGPPIIGFLSEAYGLGTAFGAIGFSILIVPLVLLPLYLRQRAGKLISLRR
ncbi:MFS transporter [Poseidonocella sedimentorum]|uniref:Predicted arabinose efflux permease, MFS family n=1 Tax=Poseidonocella sedimentorum TaxID=871652 RepID=A0A1I6DGT7_9RHOB|nr:MFS transporter [Poseidonocella sedimentorum]SFR04617.1 Predicted arabinose efflux permease, MFS family [Poseidonocella sedimentorum]